MKTILVRASLLALALCLCLSACQKAPTLAPPLVPGVSSETAAPSPSPSKIPSTPVLTLEPTPTPEPEKVREPEQLRDVHWAETYAGVMSLYRSLRSRETLKFDLIYLDEDDTPELVVDENNYNLSVFTFSNGKVYSAMLRGDYGYEYTPRKNTVYKRDADWAGLIINEDYFGIDSDHRLVTRDYPLSTWYFVDENGNGIPDETEDWVSSPASYHYGDKEVSEEEYQTHVIHGDYQAIYGTKSYEQMLKELYANVDNAAPHKDGDDLFSVLTQRSKCWSQATVAEDIIDNLTLYFSDNGRAAFDCIESSVGGPFVLNGNYVEIPTPGWGEETEKSTFLVEKMLDNGKPAIKLTATDPSNTGYDGVYRLRDMESTKRAVFDEYCMAVDFYEIYLAIQETLRAY